MGLYTYPKGAVNVDGWNQVAMLTEVTAENKDGCVEGRVKGARITTIYMICAGGGLISTDGKLPEAEFLSIHRGQVGKNHTVCGLRAYLPSKIWYWKNCKTICRRLGLL